MSIDILASPNGVAERLTGKDYLSYSSISCFQTCSLKWYFRYVERLPEKTVAAALVFGGAIHSAAEHHFRELMTGSPAPNVDTLLDAYHQAWHDRNRVDVRFGKNDDVNTLGQLAKRTLTAFQASDFSRPAGDIIGIEEELRGELVPGCPDLLARVDLIVDEGDALVVTDLKTARSRWSQNQVDQSAEQLLLYSGLAAELAPDKPVRLEFIVVTKAKEPTVDRHVVAADQRRLDRTKRIVEKVWRAIEGRHFYPCPSAMSCPGCGFRGACRDWDG